MTSADVRVRRAGIIAAGRGDRLSGVGEVKPLVAVGGRPLIDRVLASMVEAGVAQAVVIINDDAATVRDHVESGSWPIDIRWIVRSTPSSMHSFLIVLEALAAQSDDPVLISTVDTVAAPRAFARFIERSADSDADVILALTRHIDDEKPLLVAVDDDDTRQRAVRVVALGEGVREARLATAGYYVVRPAILAEAATARLDGLTALRLFFQHLLARGYSIDGVVMPDSIDVDRPADIAAAEQFLRATQS